ncbi:L-2-amino-thiazoline-4-carboxylic acid hydrolase [Fusobacterium sp.]|uniref:L-2-amino-thiazoline-4-carboxylic acid hydrolase n=1 Tax=Fusobacterium sp. TaxID=68766 RepID=UPI00262030C5|nr:L-2-amino-thiazoline-4-carboxylic acid hydrolase [Fusobacterium sp.]
MTRKELGELFYIEDHALLYGLLVKNAIKICGEKGKEAAIKGTILYAKERGLRMAMRALNDGQELTPNNYMVYGEWVDYKKVSKAEIKSITPEYRTNSLVCGWCEAWKKYNLMEYGKIYCTYIDKNLVTGFNPNNKLEIDSLLSFGEKCCAFHWVGAKFKNMDDLLKNKEKKSAISDRVLKDFLYHTAHILSAMKREFFIELGLIKGLEIIEISLHEYENEFDTLKKQAVIEESKLDFLTI